jgi:predicted lipoprotein with Yx(FWY)xxD motif
VLLVHDDQRSLRHVPDEGKNNARCLHGRRGRRDADVRGAREGRRAPPPLKAVKAGALGTILVGPGGMTVYTFFISDKDDGKSVCNGSCARKWPPLMPAANAPAPKGPLGLISRDDGSKQYTWKGKPLYYYAEDKKPGDTTGHEVGRSWFIVQP